MKIYKYTKKGVLPSPGFQFLIHKFPYFTIKDITDNRFFFICNNPVKYRDRNKTSLLYKKMEIFKYQINEIKFIDDPLKVPCCWMGYYDSKTKIFYKSRFYTQSIDIDQVLKFLQGEIE